MSLMGEKRTVERTLVEKRGNKLLRKFDRRREDNMQMDPLKKQDA